MDEIVEAALRKWPNVPHCYGWLALDARGDWYMRDDRIQAAGPFPQVKGSRIRPRQAAGLHRPQLRPTTRRWFFQNGPQRVYVQLEAAPWVWRVQWPDDRARPVTSRTPAAGARCRAPGWTKGRLFLHTDLGLGLVHSLDMGTAADALEAGAWPPHEAPFAELPRASATALPAP
jgi:hypothetical protein